MINDISSLISLQKGLRANTKNIYSVKDRVLLYESITLISMLEIGHKYPFKPAELFLLNELDITNEEYINKSVNLIKRCINNQVKSNIIYERVRYIKDIKTNNY